LGKNDGKIEGKRYFTCPQRFGLFAPLRLVEKVVTDSNDSQILARQSIISTDSNNQYHEIASLDSHLDELSTSSNEANDFPPRSPKKIKQPILSADLTVMETSLSSQVANLSETIKEKDLFIKSLQRQYEIKENENEHLIKQQLELTQHIKDLQFLESNKDDDHWLLSPDQIRIDEKTKEKILELESINKTLTQENETFQEELKRLNELIENQSNTFTDELEKQIELLKLEVTDLQSKGIDYIINSILFFGIFSFLEQIKTTQLVENETFYQQQIKKYQSQIDQIIKEEQNVLFLFKKRFRYFKDKT
jgi:CAP-Gly domain-containing linker protein 2